MSKECPKNMFTETFSEWKMKNWKIQHSFLPIKSLTLLLFITGCLENVITQNTETVRQEHQNIRKKDINYKNVGTDTYFNKKWEFSKSSTGCFKIS